MFYFPNNDGVQKNGSHRKYLAKACGLSNDLCTVSTYWYVFIFAGCNIDGGLEGVHIPYNSDGRVSGDAFVELESQEDLSTALQKDKEHMGKRYIDGKSQVDIKPPQNIKCLSLNLEYLL